MEDEEGEGGGKSDRTDQVGWDSMFVMSVSEDGDGFGASAWAGEGADVDDVAAVCALLGGDIVALGLLEMQERGAFGRAAMAMRHRWQIVEVFIVGDIFKTVLLRSKTSSGRLSSQLVIGITSLRIRQDCI